MHLFTQIPFLFYTIVTKGQVFLKLFKLFCKDPLPELFPFFLIVLIFRKAIRHAQFPISHPVIGVFCLSPQGVLAPFPETGFDLSP